MSEIYEKLADKLVKLQGDIDRRRSDPNRRRALPREQAILGGFVKAFKFTYDPSKTNFEGTFWFDRGDGNHHEHEATFVLMGAGQSAITANSCFEIVNDTFKLNDEAVLSIYFTAYCEQLKRWVLACEKFKSYLFDEMQKEPATLPAFFTDGLKLELHEYWRVTVRNLIHVLALSFRQGVPLNNLNHRDGYVIVPSGAIKVFSIGKSPTADSSPKNDLSDLRSLFWSNAFFNGKTSEEWYGFDFLLGKSALFTVDDWESVILNHPTLLSPSADAADNHGRLTCYHEIERFMWDDLTDWDRLAFINALYLKMPQYRMVPNIEKFPRQNVIFTLEQEQVYQLVHGKSNSDSRIYVAVIIAVRNLVRHGYDCSVGPFRPGWDKNRIALEIKLLFGGFMSMAYTVSKLPIAEWHRMACRKKNLYR